MIIFLLLFLGKTTYMINTDLKSLPYNQYGMAKARTFGFLRTIESFC